MLVLELLCDLDSFGVGFWPVSMRFESTSGSHPLGSAGSSTRCVLTETGDLVTVTWMDGSGGTFAWDGKTTTDWE